VTAWDYMYKSEFKARAELSAESELVLATVELPPTAPMNGAKIEIKIQAIGFAKIRFCSARLHTARTYCRRSRHTHTSRVLYDLSCLLWPNSCKLVTVRRMHLKLVFSSRNRTGVHSTSCVVTPLLFVSCAVKGHA